MYLVTSLAALAVLAGAVVYEVHRQRAAWRRFEETLERLKGSRCEPCPL